MTRGLLDLADARCGDPLVSGAKAAGLHRALRAGLPVLPGAVVPVGAGATSAARGAAALERGGSGRARMEAMATPLADALRAALDEHVRAQGSTVVVRSSSTREGDTAWSGAFSSFDGIGPAEVDTAVRGVWASAFGVDALRRAEATGVAPGEAHLAVLVQRELQPDHGGTARVLRDGAVEVVATRGGPRDLLSGWAAGWRAVVTPDGEVRGTEAEDHLGVHVLRAVAALARDAQARLGATLIEWAACGPDLTLLQVATAAGRVAPVAGAPAPAAGPDAWASPAALGLARLAVRAPGALGDALVLPIAAGLAAAAGTLPAAAAIQPAHSASHAPADPRGDLRRARELAAALVRQVWELPPARAGAAWAALVRELLGPDPVEALEAVGRLRPVDAPAVEEVLALLDGVAEAAAARGLVPHARWAWRYGPEELDRLLAGEVGRQPAAGTGPDRWEPFVHAAVTAAGTPCQGEGAVDGIAAGPVRVVLDPHADLRLGGREVLVAERPVPALAPLLWSAGALVTTAGTAGAHLVEVARSCGVATVVQVDLTGVAPTLRALAQGPPRLAAVDGAAGTVTIA